MQATGLQDRGLLFMIGSSSPTAWPTGRAPTGSADACPSVRSQAVVALTGAGRNSLVTAPAGGNSDSTGGSRSRSTQWTPDSGDRGAPRAPHPLGRHLKNCRLNPSRPPAIESRVWHAPATGFDLPEEPFPQLPSRHGGPVVSTPPPHPKGVCHQGRQGAIQKVTVRWSGFAQDPPYCVALPRPGTWTGILTKPCPGPARCLR